MDTNLTDTVSQLACPARTDGRILLGPMANDRYANWRLYTDNMMWGGLIVGAAGCGSLVVLAALAESAQQRGDTAIWFTDGYSNPELATEADWAVGRTGAKDMLAAADQIITERQTAHPEPGFTPKPPHRAGLLVLVDDCRTTFTDPECVELATRIAATGGKTGVVLACTARDTALSSFGGSAALRTALMDANTITLTALLTLTGTGHP